MENPYTGNVELKIRGETYTINFDWDALAKLKANIDDEQLSAIMNGQDLTLLAEVLAIGLQKNHKGMTAAKVKQLSPPFVLAVEALNRALQYAYYGPETDFQNHDEDDEKKTNRKTRRAAKSKTK